MTYSEQLSRAMETPEAMDPPLGILESLIAARDGRAKAVGKADASEGQLLAVELAYDEALIRISAAMSIETSPANFSNPLQERDRLEHQLARIGPNWNEFIYPEVMHHQSRFAFAA